MPTKKARWTLVILLSFTLTGAGCSLVASPTPVLGTVPPLPTLPPTAVVTPATPTPVATAVVPPTRAPTASPTPAPTIAISPTVTPPPALKVLWRTSFDGPIGALTVDSGRVFVGIGQGNPGPDAMGGADVGLVVALSATSGERLWTHDL